MARVVFEISQSNWFGKDYKSFDTSFINIGRSYHNDLILFDSHVSGRHLLITQDQDGWIVEDLDSENGLYINNNPAKVKKAKIRSGDKLTIGRTHLRILSPDHPIPKTKLNVQTNKFLKGLSKPVNVCSAAIGMLLLYAFETLYHSPKDLLIQKLLLSSVGFLFIAVIWAGIWAFVGTVIKHKARFFFQLSISCFFMFCLIPFVNFSAYLGYYANSQAVEGFSYIVLLGGSLFWLLSSNLLIATNISRKARLIVSLFIPLSLVSIMALSYSSFKDDFNTYPFSNSSLKPPIVKLLPTKSIDSFIKISSEIFTFNKNDLKQQ